MIYLVIVNDILMFVAKRQPGKSKEEAQMEKKQQLERRLEDVKDQLNVSQPKKTPKKSKNIITEILIYSYQLFKCRTLLWSYPIISINMQTIRNKISALLSQTQFRGGNYVA